MSNLSDMLIAVVCVCVRRRDLFCISILLASFCCTRGALGLENGRMKFKGVLFWELDGINGLF